MAGKHTIQPPTAARWPLMDPSVSPFLSDHIHLVSFRENAGGFSYSQHYYQERFNFSDPENDMTLKDYLGGSSDRVNQVASLFNVKHLLPLSFLKLSNGQTRRARIAKALLRNPSLLILDEPLMGLDVEHRQQLLAVLGNLAAESMPVVLVLRPQDEFPPWATRVIEVQESSIHWEGKPEAYQARRKALVRPSQAKPRAKDTSHHPAVVELKQVKVSYQGQPVLQDISWTVREGERWALMGPNGSGKTTLLSFLTGDHPQAYANDLSLFGRRRGTGESIWDIKENVGLVSPEVHLYFNPHLSALETAGTGFFDGVVPRPLNGSQEGRIEQLFDEFGIRTLLHRPLSAMSTGEQRLVLLVRSLVKTPKLILWDEPFQGLDDTMIHKVNRWLENHMGERQTLIMVTHHEEEIPASVNQRFKLKEGGTQA
ncbi:P-loop containing nucleoside triphosphate hydrolase protein [Sporodiniella umbellata]|nr:P-loop containing nucleoside triphosphate hydrolase protein [Sporodiniella umbellata]